MRWLLFIGYFVFFETLVYTLGCTIPAFENLTVQSDFNLNKFLGIWFEIKWLPNEPHNDSDIWRNFYQSFQLENSSSQRLIVSGKARSLNDVTCFPIDPWSIIANNSAKMILEKQDLNSEESFDWPYYILKTDYDHYALIYACESSNYTVDNPCLSPALWLFSRTTSLSNDYLLQLDNYIANTLCINLTTLEITPQDGISCYSSSSSKLCVFNLILFIFLLIIYI